MKFYNIFERLMFVVKFNLLSLQAEKQQALQSTC